jgi:hypothetical protein
MENDSPIGRYLTDVHQAHERLALALERQGGAPQPEATASHPDTQDTETGSSISLCDENDTETKEERDGMTAEMMLSVMYVFSGNTPPYPQ